MSLKMHILYYLMEPIVDKETKAAGGFVILNEEKKEVLKEGIQLHLAHSNNEAEYATLKAGLEKCKSMGIRRLMVKGDALLIVRQVQGTWACKNSKLLQWLHEVNLLMNDFEAIQIQHISRQHNKEADNMANTQFQVMVGAIKFKKPLFQGQESMEDILYFLETGIFEEFSFVDTMDELNLIVKSVVQDDLQVFKVCSLEMYDVIKAFVAKGSVNAINDKQEARDALIEDLKKQLVAFKENLDTNEASLKSSAQPHMQEEVKELKTNVENGLRAWSDVVKQHEENMKWIDVAKTQKLSTTPSTPSIINNTLEEEKRKKVRAMNIFKLLAIVDPHIPLVELTQQFTKALHAAVETAFPHSGGSNSYNERKDNKPRNGWYDDECRQLRARLNKDIATRNTTHKQRKISFRHLVRRKKRNFLAQLKQELYELFLSQDSKETWKLFDEKQEATPITSVDTWEKYARNLYTVPNQPSLIESLANHPQTCSFFTKSMVRDAIAKLHTGKKQDHDGLVAEHLRHAQGTLACLLAHMFNRAVCEGFPKS
ncbi:hypothetical protein L7F22_052212 [Adiantum nelumboides]|nr:hypothetical protein [Adiantum nelumboides]